MIYKLAVTGSTTGDLQSESQVYGKHLISLVVSDYCFTVENNKQDQSGELVTDF